jgi:hypothetical protein
MEGSGVVNRGAAALALLWLGAVGAGFSLLLRDESTPGVAAAAPVTWPDGVPFDRAADRATLVLLVHPKCPCSRATLDELSEVMARTRGAAAAYVLLLRPSGTAAGWERTGYWQSAEAIPGVKVMADPDGAVAARFGVSTSGDTLAYGPSGELLYHGGITGGRGHSGDNVARARLVSLLLHGRADRADSPVFGCPLRDPEAGGS